MSIIIPANSAAGGGFDVANSARFNKASADNLIRTFGTATNRKKWTLSMWTKRSSTAQAMLYSTTSASSYYQFQSGAQLELNDVPGSTYNYRLVTNAIYRDITAWMHIVIAFDSTQGTDSNRIKLYVNGEQPSLATATYPSQNFEPRVNNAEAQKFGSYDGSTDFSYDGYFSELTFIDGTQNDVTDFGEFDSDSGIWKAIDVSGLTFGNNGFHLDFKDSSALGNDAAGSNNFTANNLTAIDQSTDTCTNNFCTMNSLAASSYSTLSEGNTQTKGASASDNGNVISTFAPNSGKWYCESLVQTGKPTGYPSVGLAQVSDANFGTVLNSTVGTAGYNSAQSGVIRPDGQRYSNNSTASWTVTTYDTNDILMMAMDCDNGAFYIGKNGTWMNSGNPNSGSSRTNAFLTWTPASQEGQAFATRDYNGSVLQWNFGSPAFAISSGNTDGDGYGNFEYAVPSGYFSLNTKNLAEYG